MTNMKGRYLLLTNTVLVMLVCFVCVTNAVQPVIENMDYSPKNPAPLSTVTFQATVNEQNVTVYVFVEECRDDLCYADIQNMTMTNIGMNHYQKNVTLKHSEANLVHYQIIVKKEGEWHKSEMEEFALASSNEGDEDGGIPGFEGAILIMALVAMVALAKKRR